MPWPIYLAFKQLFPRGILPLVLTGISMMGVAVGVMALLVSSSIMGGFGHQIRQMIIDTQGEIQIKARSSIGLEQSKAVEQILLRNPAVVAFAPYAGGMVMLENDRKPAFPAIQGFNYEQMRKVIPIQNYVVQGSLEDLDDDSVILSSKLASSLGAVVGNKVSVYSPLMMERIKRNEILLPREVRVAGIFHIGHQQLDSSTVLCSLRLMQDLYGLKQAFHGYNVRLKPDADIDVAAVNLNNELPLGVSALTWFESNEEFQAVLSFERNMIFIMLLVIVVVAAFAIMGMLLVTVVWKTREIGLIGALGGKAHEVAACFCIRGLFIGVVGTILGLILGFVVLHYRNSIIYMISKMTMGPEVFERFYQFSSLPSYTQRQDIILIVSFTLAASTLAGLIPAWFAARLKPVEALRSE